MLKPRHASVCRGCFFNMVITVNRKARHDYTVVETFEAGICLVGSEVKSCIAKQVSIAEAYCVVRDGELFMRGASIAEYANSSVFNHEKVRDRKLLMHRRQILRLKSEVERNGMTIVPLDMHLSERGRIKVSIGLCRGRNTVDKREHVRERETNLELRRKISR